MLHFGSLLCFPSSDYKPSFLLQRRHFCATFGGHTGFPSVKRTSPPDQDTLKCSTKKCVTRLIFDGISLCKNTVGFLFKNGISVCNILQSHWLSFMFKKIHLYTKPFFRALPNLITN
ncbi:hypothetical protein GOP47_0003494 [Adiantum capillus-veneris]|uniref:Uncharacterized protein n=1 Tax=Adiantum capillus-veneris TaxID=13818 RepID=A0A9D4VDP2_ADICA|nr:hypothetical protein GOP47_0003494 [Adiantum capillus-veneris]